MGKEQVDELVQQFIERNKEQLPNLLKLRRDIHAEFQEVKAAQGIHVAILTAYKTIDSI